MRGLTRAGLLVLVCLAFFPRASAGIDAGLLRYPDVSATQIAFVYAGDIWVAPKEGGTAIRLSTPAGEESFPRFSPDGRWIAFSGNYDGNQDIYLIPSEGGVATRLTHHPMPDRMLGWFPDGKHVLYASSMKSGKQRFNQFYKVSVAGGDADKLPVPYGEFGAISPDGEWLAYMPVSRDFRTWKRYRGGSTTDILLFNLKDYSSKNITTTNSNDGQPMWHGKTLYFQSDRNDFKRSNIYSYDTTSGAVKQLTNFEKYDTRFPSIGPDRLVFENGGKLYLLNLADGSYDAVEVDVVTDKATVRPRQVSVASLIRSGDISPSGKRAVFQARGELFTVPAEHGPVLNLTRSSGVAERYPTWSPDGSEIAYFSDRSGEYELTVRPADGKGEEKTLTKLGPGYRYQPTWSPDGKKLLFVDQAMNVQLHDRDSGETKAIDKGLYWMHGGLSSFSASWSADGRWVTYAIDQPQRTAAIVIFDTKNDARHQVTSGFHSDGNPVFDPDGKYLYFLTSRTYQPSYSDYDTNWIYANSTTIAAVPLRKDVPSPLATRNDVEEAKDKSDENGEEKKDGDAKKGKKDKKGDDGKGEEKKDEGEKKPDPVEIDLDGFESRIVMLPAEPGNYGNLLAVSGKVLYLRMPRTGAAPAGPGPGGGGDIVLYGLDDREEQTVLSGANGFSASGDGKKLLVVSRGSFGIVDVAPNQKLEKPLRTAEMTMTVDPPAEWRQVFQDAWRFERDYFYDPNMHGVDWNEMRTRYGKLIDEAVTRWDVNFVLGELIAELNASHAYRGGGDEEQPEQQNVGLLGADVSVANGAYRIDRILRGAAWDTEVRSPFAEPGLEVAEGDYLLAVNGSPIDTTKDIWAGLQGLAGMAVSLTVNDEPTTEGAREIVITTLDLDHDLRLRNLAWIEGNRKKVEEATGGRVGYVYVPSTGLDGQAELVRMFYGQAFKDGLIIDERFNNGGQIPDRFIELLNRPLRNYWAVRDGLDWQWPPIANIGPKVMLANEWSGSGGDLFPFYFKQSKIGPLVGTRTWGGLIGISGAPNLIDGGVVTVPTFGIYDVEKGWLVEGYGVDPDIEVDDDPSLMVDGGDPQLDRAIEEALRLLETNPPARANKPAYPDRSGY